MSYGFEVYNDAGSVQISSNSQNWVLVDQGYENGGFLDAHGAGPGMYQKTVRANVNRGQIHQITNFIVAIRPANGIGAYVMGSGYWAKDAQTPPTLAPEFILRALAQNAQVYWYVFEKPQIDALPPLPPYGIAVWDAAGRIAYRSDIKPMRVVQNVVGNTFAASVQLPGGHVYAFINGARKHAWIANRCYAAFGRVDGASVIFQEHSWPQNSANYQRRMSNLIVDVTNF